jgi:hypothetical protein
MEEYVAKVGIRKEERKSKNEIQKERKEKKKEEGKKKTAKKKKIPFPAKNILQHTTTTHLPDRIKYPPTLTAYTRQHFRHTLHIHSTQRNILGAHAPAPHTHTQNWIYRIPDYNSTAYASKKYGEDIWHLYTFSTSHPVEQCST